MEISILSREVICHAIQKKPRKLNDIKMINFKRKTLLNTQQKHFRVFSQHFLQSMADGTA